MRKINKQIILLSIILTFALLNNNNINAATHKKSVVNKNHELIESNRSAIEASLKNNDYNLFVYTVKNLGVNEEIDQSQFDVLVSAYNLFKNNKKDDAVKLLKDNDLNPLLIKFINNRLDLTNEQKNILKKASDLIKEGKTEDAKELMKTAGLSQIPMKMDKKIIKIENKVVKEELKKALNESRKLKKIGKIDESKKILKDVGILHR